MAYYRREPPKDPSLLAGFLRQELERIQAELSSAQELLRVSQSNVAPDKPRQGDVRYADGTNWNPLSDATEQYVWFDGTAWQPFGGSGGATTFLALTDTPADYSAQASKFVAVNVGETGLEFVTATPGSVQIDEYSTPGADSWTKPTGAALVRIEMVGGGGGGASGARGAAGTYRPGGPGGGGGGYYCATYKADELDATLTLEIGAGGTGGAAKTTDDTAGSDGSDGGDTYAYDSATWVAAYGGKAGIAGTIDGSASVGGDGGQSGLGDTSDHSVYYATYNRHTNPMAMPFTVGPFGGTGVSGDCGASAHLGGGGGGGASNDGQLQINNGTNLANAGWAGGGSMHGGGGGGGGGSIGTGNTAQRGGLAGKHGWMMHQLQTSNTAGSGAAGAAGATTNEYPMSISNGGGGGGASTSGAAGAGGSAGRGGGGGGGGASVNGNNSGAGGDGGDGFIRITTFF